MMAGWALSRGIAARSSDHPFHQSENDVDCLNGLDYDTRCCRCLTFVIELGAAKVCGWYWVGEYDCVVTRACRNTKAQIESYQYMLSVL